ncbi:peptide chain release factor N(5)-glutamine methyltransferase [Singulisphaera rosea]
MPRDSETPRPYPRGGDTPRTPAPSTQEERWTVGRLLIWTTDFLKRRGAESPRLDAEVLLAHILKWERVKLYTHFEEEIGETARAGYRELVRRRSEGMPVAYLVGRKEFYSLTLAVSPAVLIPRPDSEFVVVEFLAVTKTLESPRAVDVGTGSGCLALACTHQHKSARFVAIDLSLDALEVAESNAKTLGLSDRVEFRQGDRLAPVAGEGPFDVIVSNPPYIASDVIPTLEPGVRDYEPHLALDGGSDGLRVVAPLIEESARLLKSGGSLILEIGSDQERPVRDLIAARPEFTLAPTIRDHANHPRVIRATRN